MMTLHEATPTTVVILAAQWNLCVCGGVGGVQLHFETF